jgi:hypothetical protein
MTSGTAASTSVERPSGGPAPSRIGFRPPRRVARAAKALTATPVLAVALAVLAWPVESRLRAGSVGLNSWPTALHLVAHHHFLWGSDLAYTYGPLGFLRFPLVYFEGTTRLALIYIGATQIALSATLLYVLRRAVGVWVGCALTLLALCLVPDERVAAVVFIWAVVALRADAPPIVRAALVPAAGFLGATEMLVKFNSGIVVLTIGAIVALALPGRARNLLALVGGFVASFLALWLLAEQRVGDIPSYLRGSKEIVSGYGPALGGADSDTSTAVVAALLSIAIVFAVARDAVAGAARRLHWAVFPLWGVVAFLLFKEGFVRSDTNHRPIFFAFALCALLAFAWQRRQTARLLLATGALALAAAWSFQGSDLVVPTPGSRFDAVVSQARMVVQPATLERQATRVGARLRSHYNIDARTLAELGHHSMTIMPWDFAAAYAYRLRWQPLPTIQPSQGYTTWLDEHAAHVLGSQNGPERILRAPELTLDRRNAAWDMPAAMRTILCRYDELSVRSRWQVLARGRDRCGKPTTITTIRARWGQRVAVPPPPHDAFMLVRIGGVQPHGLEALGALLYRPDTRWILVNHHPYRLVPGTAADGLVLWIPPAADYTNPFGLSQPAHTLAVWRDQKTRSDSAEITYRFEQVPIQPLHALPG